MRHVILGCGDIGRRIALELKAQGVSAEQIVPFVNSPKSYELAQSLGLTPHYFELDIVQHETLYTDRAKRRSDNELTDLQIALLNNSLVYYTVAPQRSGQQDLRSRALIEQFKRFNITPNKLVLISTTGVYGDAKGQWVDESCTLNPSTDRAQRRYDSEVQWQRFMQGLARPLIVLRVPGIYANSRLPIARVRQANPVVRSAESGFTNRIHADDLAAICVKANQHCYESTVMNATDGTPGSITEYLQAVAEYLGEPPLPEISLEQAQKELSEGMLSYLSESRKISNAKMCKELEYELRYPDFRQGLQF